MTVTSTKSTSHKLPRRPDRTAQAKPLCIRIRCDNHVCEVREGDGASGLRIGVASGLFTTRDVSRQAVAADRRAGYRS